MTQSRLGLELNPRVVKPNSAEGRRVEMSDETQSISVGFGR